MTLFERHVAKRLLKGFVLFIGSLIIFFIVLHWVEYSDDFLDGGATVAEVFTVFYPSYIPEIIRLTSPLALFLSCIYVTGTLAQELQLIALQTSGVSLYRLMRPYVLVGTAVTIFMFGFNGWVVPRTNEVVVRYENEYLPHGNESTDVSEMHRQNDPRTILSVGYYDRDRKRAHDVSLQRFNEHSHLVSRLDAERMEWIDSLKTWRMETVVRRSFHDSRMTEEPISSVDTTLQIYPRDLARSQNDVAAMTIPVARNYLAALRRAGVGNLERPLVAYYNKFAYPFANLILILIGVPLAAVRRRGGQAIRFAIGLLTAFVYLAVQKLTEPFGYAGALPPSLTAWLPHVAFAVVAIIILWRTRK
ncbi:permease [Salinibacter sp. 10B]|uniref:LptF/LptG family permease n=1 Tax=Salinibacter sp. 10B TaxID=1923971 RepID=UPI000CF519BE|nr:LptF/LptG family permease [Salinibacter sp. 10B]PQJ34100.1 permease [Salinibacter sp. 10B]